MVEFEEIKNLAQSIFLNWNGEGRIYLNPASAWENAKDFIDYTNEKRCLMEKKEKTDENTRN